jgi:ribosomal protein S12 methylthiotransferase
LLQFIAETRFERLGVFTYSQQDGTRAGKMETQIPDAIKKRRQKLAMSEQLKIARNISNSFVGREIEVLVEREAQRQDMPNEQVSSWEHGLIRSSAAGKGKGTEADRREPFLVARSEADAPDIDGRVYIRGKLPLAEFARVKIIGHTDYDLVAETV